MAKLTDLCRCLPAALGNARIYDMCGGEDVEDVIAHERRVREYEMRRASRKRDDAFRDGMTSRPSKRHCTEHVTRCGSGSYTGEKRFNGSHIHVACRVRIY